MQPAAGVEGGGGRLGIVQVAAHHAGGPDQ